MKQEEIIKGILNREECIIEVLKSGTQEEIIKFCEELSKINPMDFFEMCEDKSCFITTSDVLVFSSFNVIFDLLEQIIYSDYELSFLEIGKLIIKTQKDTAYVKFGETHSRLAEEMYLVTIGNNKGKRVKITEFGKLIAKRYKENINYIFSMLLLGNPFIQSFVYEILHSEHVNYEDHVMHLSPSSRIRRRCNTKYIIDLIGNYMPNVDLNKIDWSVEYGN